MGRVLLSHTRKGANILEPPRDVARDSSSVTRFCLFAMGSVKESLAKAGIVAQLSDAMRDGSRAGWEVDKRNGK